MAGVNVDLFATTTMEAIWSSFGACAALRECRRQHGPARQTACASSAAPVRSTAGHRALRRLARAEGSSSDESIRRALLAELRSQGWWDPHAAR
jgi:hypothetical protein